MDRHNFGKLNPDEHQSGKPDPDQSEKMEALESHFGALEGPNMEKVGGRIQIKLKGKIRIRIRVKGRIRIRINVMRIRNTEFFGRKCSREIFWKIWCSHFAKFVI
jgi:hypothetical protein